MPNRIRRLNPKSRRLRYQVSMSQCKGSPGVAHRPRSGRAHSRAQRRVCPQGIASKAVRIERSEIARPPKYSKRESPFPSPFPNPQLKPPTTTSPPHQNWSSIMVIDERICRDTKSMELKANRIQPQHV